MNKYRGRRPRNPVAQIIRGRNLRAGYERGLGINEGNMLDIVLGDPLYIEAVQTIPPGSGLTQAARANLFLILKYELCKLPQGHIIEFGSYKGGNALFMGVICKKLYPDMRIYALDTYEGLPTPSTDHDWFDPGEMSDVRHGNFLDAIGRLGLKNSIIPVKGLFQNTAKSALYDAGTIRLAYIDCDIYESVAYSYDVSLEYMVKGGYWIFDDPLFPVCIGAFEAVEEFVIQRDNRYAEQVFPNLVYRNL